MLSCTRRLDCDHKDGKTTWTFRDLGFMPYRVRLSKHLKFLDKSNFWTRHVHKR
jgi:hypothetical protein